MRPNNKEFEEIRNQRIAAIMESKPYTERRTLTASALGNMIGLEPEGVRSVIDHMLLNNQLIKTMRANKAYYTPPPASITSIDWRVDHAIHDMVDELMRDW
jgi:hypothetical protein